MSGGASPTDIFSLTNSTGEEWMENWTDTEKRKTGRGKPELLIPASSLEVLKVAVIYE